MLVQSQPFELTIGNVARRVLGLIRDAIDGGKDAIATNGVVTPFKQHANDSVVLSNENSESTVKEDVLDGVRELLDELDQADKQISEYSNEHVFPEETLLVCGGSRTIQRFLLDAAKRRKFRVFHVEGYPNEHISTHDVVTQGAVKGIDEELSVQNRLKALTAAGITVTVIPDAQMFAMMPLVTKVVLSAQGTFSNGGCLLPCGAKSIAASAKMHQKPVLVLAAIYRLCPAYPYDPNTLIEQGDPSANMAFDQGILLDNIRTTRYMRDYIPPDLVSLVATNM